MHSEGGNEMVMTRRILGMFAVAVLTSSAAYAQASIAGVVRDTSGAVLPGVTVEAASPVLIEKVRTAVTDGAGQYRIIDLRPGAYVVTFTLPGFNTVRREGIELAGDFVATVNIEMRVGALEETITVTGEAPVVDVQSARQQQVLDRELIRDIPTSRQYYSVATLIPGVTVTNQTQDVGGSALISTPDYVIHGGRPGDGRLQIDGLSVGSARSQGANRSMYAVNVGIAQETNVTTSGGLGEAETAGIVINAVPREGGNTLRGSFYFGYANSAMQGSNFNDALRAAGISAPNELLRVWEVTPTVGGPIIRDKLWWLTSARHQGTRNLMAGMYYNKNAADITKWNYEPDLDRRAMEDGTWRSISSRLTLQATTKNKFNFFWDEQDRRVGWLGGGNATNSPEAQALQFGHPNMVAQASWTNPLTSRVLLEAGTAMHRLQWSGKERPGYNRDMIRVTEQSGIIPGISYRGMTWASNWSGTYPVRASVSYVTGTHTSKFGLLRTVYTTDDRAMDPQGIAYRFNNGVPNQLTLSNSPRRVLEEHTTLGLYAQDSWRINSRLTLQGGVRYDRQTQIFPEQIHGFTRFIPVGWTVPESKGVNWNDITPRMAVAYDVAGDGRTGLKFTIGKYMVAQDGGGVFGSNLNPTQRLANSTTRAWNDANRNFVPDCDLLNPNANGECGAFSNRAFGQNVYSNNYDQDLIKGWGVRPYQWETSLVLQREVMPRVGVSGGYFRRWYGNFIVTDNLALGPQDFDSFSIVVPSDSRLPGGGGQTLTGLYNVSPTKFGLVDNFITTSTKYGNQVEYWQGVDLNVNVRGVRGITFSGGLSTGRRLEDTCEIRAALPESDPLNPYCRFQEPFLTQFKFLSAYLLPRIDVLVSATLQSAPGQQLAANFNVSNAAIAPSLGRNLAGGAANATINLVEPGTFYGDRSNQLDLRFAKVVRLGGSRTNIGIDVYNALNASPVTAYNQTFGATWPRPNAIMPARFLKLSAQIDW
jgi:hypothetical protein